MHGIRGLRLCYKWIGFTEQLKGWGVYIYYSNNIYVQQMTHELVIVKRRTFHFSSSVPLRPHLAGTLTIDAKPTYSYSSYSTSYSLVVV